MFSEANVLAAAQKVRDATRRLRAAEEERDLARRKFGDLEAVANGIHDDVCRARRELFGLLAETDAPPVIGE